MPGAPSPDAPPPGPSSPGTATARLREVAALFTRLGFTAFGGPAAHVAMMEDEVVRRRNWLDRQQFLDLVSVLNFIPGPNSTELAIHLGYLRAGYPGLVTAGACFILPAVLIVLPLAWAYVSYGSLPQVQHVLRGVSAAVVAVVVVVLWRLGRAAVVDGFTGAVALASLAAAALLQRRFPGLQAELIVLAAAALAGAVWYGRPKAAGMPPALFAAGPALLALGGAREVARMALFFLKVGATLYGSGYVLISFLQSGLVDANPPWLTQQQLLDAVAVGQVTPGPLLTTATFIGYVVGADRLGGGVPGGVLCGLLATAAIFLPSFVLVALLAPALPRLRRNRFARGALDAMNAAVAALILVVLVRLLASLLGDPLSLALAAACALALLVWDVNATWLILAGAAVGFARSLSHP